MPGENGFAESDKNDEITLAAKLLARNSQYLLNGFTQKCAFVPFARGKTLLHLTTRSAIASVRAHIVFLRYYSPLQQKLGRNRLRQDSPDDDFNTHE